MTLYSGGEGPIRFECEVEADLPSASAREPEVKEVLVNLLENTRVAIREGGTVRVEDARDGTSDLAASGRVLGWTVAIDSDPEQGTTVPLDLR